MEHGTTVETVRYSPFNLVGQDSTKRVYSTIPSLLPSTVKCISEWIHIKFVSLVKNIWLCIEHDSFYI